MNLCAWSERRPPHSTRQTQMTENTCVPSRTKTLLPLNLTFRWNEQGRAGVSAIRVPPKKEHGKKLSSPTLTYRGVRFKDSPPREAAVYCIKLTASPNLARTDNTRIWLAHRPVWVNWG